MRSEAEFEGGRLLPLVEEFYTVQGEGCHTGKPAYFIRIGGCDVGCRWCDAKFTWNDSLFPLTDVSEIAAKAASCRSRSIVITGGEPLRYPMGMLTGLLHAAGIEIFLETSGTHPLSGEFDWVCLSPKRQKPPLDDLCARADELKVIVENSDDFAWACDCAARVSGSCRLYLQPEWSRYSQIIPEVVAYVKEHPEWSISLQAHKFMRIP